MEPGLLTDNLIVLESYVYNIAGVSQYVHVLLLYFLLHNIIIMRNYFKRFKHLKIL